MADVLHWVDHYPDVHGHQHHVTAASLHVPVAAAPGYLVASVAPGSAEIVAALVM